MCKWGNIKTIIINGKKVDVDEYIVPMVKALNKAGLETIASCCGHGKQPVSIVLKDGREIRIFKNYKDARKVDKLFPPIS